MAIRIGDVIKLEHFPIISGFGAVCGKKEGEGPLSKFFDKIYDDIKLSQKTWERAESQMQKEASDFALRKAHIQMENIDVIFAGDLIDQCISSIFALKKSGCQFLGQFGACSTMAQTLIISSLMIETGAFNNCLAVTSSHFCAAERQYRFPLEYGGQRSPSAQWTVSGAGAAVISFKNIHKNNSEDFDLLYIDSVLIGKIVDFGIKDSGNMGAAMAPAAADTISSFFNETKTNPSDFDLILTGDLGFVGSEILKKMLLQEGIDISSNHDDCGMLIFDKNAQDVHSGGSGCGCSASVLCSYILQRMKNHELNNILFIATGALMSPTSFKQGETIPGIAHLVNIRNTSNTKSVS